MARIDSREPHEDHARRRRRPAAALPVRRSGVPPRGRLVDEFTSGRSRCWPSRCAPTTALKDRPRSRRRRSRSSSFAHSAARASEVDLGAEVALRVRHHAFTADQARAADPTSAHRRFADAHLLVIEHPEIFGPCPLIALVLWIRRYFAVRRRWRASALAADRTDRAMPRSVRSQRHRAIAGAGGSGDLREAAHRPTSRGAAGSAARSSCRQDPRGGRGSARARRPRGPVPTG